MSQPCQNSHESQIQTRIPHTFIMFLSGKCATCQILCEFREEKHKKTENWEKTSLQNILSVIQAQELYKKGFKNKMLVG